MGFTSDPARCGRAHGARVVWLLGLLLVGGCRMPLASTTEPAAQRPGATGTPVPTTEQAPSPAVQRYASTPVQPSMRATVVPELTLADTPTTATEPILAPTVASTGLTETPAATTVTLPEPTLFKVVWEDRALFRQGLIAKEQAVLDELPGATVYHMDVQISDDLSNLE
ncbi:MAG: hypothetical protein ACRDIB_09215, partial [Ardenticatenaceae bacterium]